MTAILELRAITDGRDDGRGGLGSNALDGRDALTWLAAAKNSVDLFVEDSDTAVKIAE